MSEEKQDYSFWKKALIGQVVEIHDSDPQAGFYRTKGRDGIPVPVAIWREGGKMVALKNDNEPIDADEVWTWCCRYPISHDVYQAVIDGHPWPDLDPAVIASLQPPAYGRNTPPDEHSMFEDQIESALAGMSLVEEITDDDGLGKAQSLRSRINEIANEADKRREELKRPFLEGSRGIDSVWMPMIKACKEASDKLKANMNKFLKKRQAAIAAREEMAGGENGAAPQRSTPLPDKIKGAYGRGTSTVERYTVTDVTDWPVLLAYLQPHPEMQKVARELAQRAVDKGFDVPGVRTEKERVVK